MYTSQQIREIYKKLPQKIREIIVSPELHSIFISIAKINNLNDKHRDSLVKIVVDVLMGINAKESMFESIKNTGLDEVLAKKISNAIESQILNNLDQIYAQIISNIESEDANKQNKNLAKPEPQKQEPPTEENIKSYDSFEQTILRQAQAMRVAQAPNNLPGATTIQASPQHRPAGNDPYRESIE